MAVLIVEVLVKILIALLNGQLPICPALATSSQRLTPPSFSQFRIWTDISIQNIFRSTKIFGMYTRAFKSKAETLFALGCFCQAIRFV